MRRSSHETGFAYLWLLLFVAFLGIGVTVAAELDSLQAQRDRERELISIGRQFRTAIGRYYENRQMGGLREYPASLDDLLRDNRAPGLVRHLRKIFVDPMTGKAEWGLVQIGGRIVGIHSLSERIPFKQDGFDAEEASFRGKQKLSEWVFTYPADLMLRVDANGALLPSSLDPLAPGQASASPPVPGQSLPNWPKVQP
ncbi:MAG: type II secretion system protein [Betaproteobacteria bacterium]|nr:type II secretion system protein [Betaproteobacteria bacterium]